MSCTPLAWKPCACSTLRPVEIRWSRVLPCFIISDMTDRSCFCKRLRLGNGRNGKRCCATFTGLTDGDRDGFPLLPARRLAPPDTPSRTHPPVDGRHPRGLCLSLPSVEHRQRPRLGNPHTVRIRGLLARRRHHRRRHHPLG